MFWPMLAIALGFLGLAVLGVLAVRVFVEAQRLGRQVAGHDAADQPRGRGPGTGRRHTARSADALGRPAASGESTGRCASGDFALSPCGVGGTLLIAARQNEARAANREYARGLPQVYP